MIHVELSNVPLDADAARIRVASPGHGAVLVFYGNVRDHHEGRQVIRVDYSAYEPMARQELLAIASEMMDAHRVGAVVVLHRVGPVEVGETSLVVAIGSAHRRAAFDCGLAVIDEIKRRVPIWKREVSPDGSTWQDGQIPGAP